MPATIFMNPYPFKKMSSETFYNFRLCFFFSIVRLIAFMTLPSFLSSSQVMTLHFRATLIIKYSLPSHTHTHTPTIHTRAINTKCVTNTTTATTRETAMLNRISQKQFLSWYPQGCNKQPQEQLPKHVAEHTNMHMPRRICWCCRNFKIYECS